jgi:5-(hydroxymethyl)furfural/furfural oxidase
MGANASARAGMAVCDPDGLVIGVPGIVVADASLMPQIPRANTNLPAIMIAERIAQTLL